MCDPRHSKMWGIEPGVVSSAGTMDESFGFNDTI